MVDMYQAHRQLHRGGLQKCCSRLSFADFSDSINTFIFEPLGGQPAQLPEDLHGRPAVESSFPLVVDGIDAVDCDVIALRWHATFGEAQGQPRRPILRTTKKAGWWQISRIDVEFNSLTWLLDMGGNYPGLAKCVAPNSPTTPLLLQDF